jgi:hypothetical protein
LALLGVKTVLERVVGLVVVGLPSSIPVGLISVQLPDRHVVGCREISSIEELCDKSV